MRKQLAPAEYVLVLLLASIANFPQITSAAEQPPNWSQAQHDATAALMQPGATLAALVEQVNAQPPADAQQALFTLNVLARAGIGKRSIIVVRHLKQIYPKFNGSEISQMYYDACDHLRAWDLAQAMLEAYPDDISDLDLDNRLIKHLLESGWSADRIDNWLAEKPVGVQNFWIKARLRFNQRNSRGVDLEKKLADAVRAQPENVAGAIAYLEIVTQVFASNPNSKPDVSFMAETVKPKLATEASEMAGYFSRLKMFEQAAAFYRQATTIELTADEARRLGYGSQAMFSEPAMRTNFEVNVREQLAECLLQLNKDDEAQKWKAEAADIRAKIHVPGQPFFVGPNLRGVAPIAREKKPEEKPAEVAPNLAGHLQVVPAVPAAENKGNPEEKSAENDPRYWYDRAEKYRGSGEAAEEEKALKKGLALAKPKPEPAPMGIGLLDLRTILLSNYANLLKRQNRDDEAISFLRQELADSPANSVSCLQAARMLGFDLTKSLKADDAVLWTWLENRAQWTDVEERLLWEMLKNAKKDDLDKDLARAEKLAMNVDPSRASTVGWIENRMDCAKRSLPLLEYAVKNTNDGELLGKTKFTLLESYLDSGDWKRAEEIFPDAAARLTDSELPQWYGRLAVVAAKAGAKDDAMRIWNRAANLDLTVVGPVDELGRTGLKDELIDFYQTIQRQIPSSEIPARVIATLQKS